MSENNQTEGNWWCARCNTAPEPSHVTYQEHHTECGHPVEYIAPGDKFSLLIKERDAALAEVAKWKFLAEEAEAYSLLRISCDLYKSMLEQLKAEIKDRADDTRFEDRS